MRTRTEVATVVARMREENKEMRYQDRMDNTSQVTGCWGEERESSTHLCHRPAAKHFSN